MEWENQSQIEELRRAVVDLNERGLIYAARWSAELLHAMVTYSTMERIQQAEKKTTRTVDFIKTPVDARFTFDEDDLLEQSSVFLAKTYFDLKEYRRVSNLLKVCKGNKATFLRRYSLFLAGEYQKEQEILETAGNQSGSASSTSNNISAPTNNKNNTNNVTTIQSVMNRELKTLQEEFQQIFKSERSQIPISEKTQSTAVTSNNNNNRNENLFISPSREVLLDPFNMYLYVVVLKELDQKDFAVELLIKSLNLYPCNWTAWETLLTLIDNTHRTNNLSSVSANLSKHWMKDFFLAFAALELQQNQEALQMYDRLQERYPRSTYILSQRAIANYNLREFDVAEKLFETLLQADPFRLDNLDVYSNILYVKENKVNLSFLAHRSNETDKYRPETCCIIGNYYSLKSDHHKAVVYFQRALKLNRRFLPALTLMGHEYVEMKNTRAAIEAYRKAVEINPRDYRAWYGLGQTYEILKMPLYSLYYYNKATSLRPYDSRMWCAVGTCYERLGRMKESIKCYERALTNEDTEGIALHKLAELYQGLNDYEKAAYYYRKNLALREQERIEGQETIDALIFLARYYKNIEDLNEAEKYSAKLLDFSGKAKEEGKALLREIHNVRVNLGHVDRVDDNDNENILDMSME